MYIGFESGEIYFFLFSKKFFDRLGNKTKQYFLQDQILTSVMNEGLKIIAGHQKDELTIEKLKKLISEPELKEEDARAIISGIDILVDIIIDFQAEQELKQSETNINLKQAA